MPFSIITIYTLEDDDIPYTEFDLETLAEYEYSEFIIGETVNV